MPPEQPAHPGQTAAAAAAAAAAATRPAVAWRAGIAKRLDINWQLARKFQPMAEQALACGEVRAARGWAAPGRCRSGRDGES